MADHTITMKTPPIELGRQDVEFDVTIDGVKRGTLRVSEGGVEWRKGRGRLWTATTWSQLATFLES
jgi:hypothetical protein